MIFQVRLSRSMEHTRMLMTSNPTSSWNHQEWYMSKMFNTSKSR